MVPGPQPAPGPSVHFVSCESAIHLEPRESPVAAAPAAAVAQGSSSWSGPLPWEAPGGGGCVRVEKLGPTINLSLRAVVLALERDANVTFFSSK